MKELLIDLENMRSDKSEGSLYHAYQCNIAMAFKDAWDNWGAEEYKSNVPFETIHEIANQAAKNFLDLLIKE